MGTNIYTIKISYETEFEIEAENKDDAELDAAKEFWKQPEKAELLGLDVISEAIELTSQEEDHMIESGMEEMRK